MLKKNLIGFLLVCLWGAESLGDAPTLMDLKKADFSFLVELKVGSRCFLRNEVGEALIRVQKVFQLTGHRLKLLKCYVPTEREFSEAIAVVVQVVDKQGAILPMTGLGKSNRKRLWWEMEKEGFTTHSEGTGFFSYRALSPK
ncbi:MAG: hypothetical protein EB078_00275 [Proteobacteria bacterium]|nr:hypothetical protein [Pseudomonadota bacterium]NDC23045.1 hypothetical protein [Pseudomonadota bacterium]NDD03316.1 hypothetical protein [Pseudomonadota bacterium]NDG27326.1 hypothetical protein [Pseudomonadota bacterium]